MKELLNKLEACASAVEWVQEKSVEESWETCERGDWMLWLAFKLKCDKRLLTLAKGLCAQTVIHLMKDSRSKEAVQGAIDFGNGHITERELRSLAAVADAAAAAAAYAYAATYAAAAADAAAAAAADAAAADAAAAAAYAATAYAAYAAYAATAYADAATAYADAARKENQLLTAKIVREIISIDIVLELIEKF